MGRRPPSVPTLPSGDESPMNRHQAFPRGHAAELRGQDEVACGARENGPKCAKTARRRGARVAVHGAQGAEALPPFTALP